MLHLRILSLTSLAIFVCVFNGLVGIAVEDYFGISGGSLFSYIIGSYWNCFSWLLVSGLFFLVSDGLMHRHKSYAEGAGRLGSVSLSIAISIASIVVLINCTMIVKTVFDLEFGLGKCAGKIVNILTALVFIVYSIAEVRIQGNSKFKKYWGLVIVSFGLILSLKTSCQLENLFLLEDIKDDLELKKKIRGLSYKLSEKNVVYNITSEVAKNIGEQIAASLCAGEVQYKKVSDTEFSLSCEFKVSTDDYRKIRRLHKTKIRDLLHAAELEPFPSDSHKSGLNTKTFKLKKPAVSK